MGAAASRGPGRRRPGGCRPGAWRGPPHAHPYAPGRRTEVTRSAAAHGAAARPPGARLEPRPRAAPPTRGQGWTLLVGGGLPPLAQRRPRPAPPAVMEACSAVTVRGGRRRSGCRDRRRGPCGRAASSPADSDPPPAWGRGLRTRCLTSLFVLVRVADQEARVLIRVRRPEPAVATVSGRARRLGLGPPATVRRPPADGSVPRCHIITWLARAASHGAAAARRRFGSAVPHHYLRICRCREGHGRRARLSGCPR